MKVSSIAGNIADGAVAATTTDHEWFHIDWRAKLAGGRRLGQYGSSEIPSESPRGNRPTEVLIDKRLDRHCLVCQDSCAVLGPS